MILADPAGRLSRVTRRTKGDCSAPMDAALCGRIFRIPDHTENTVPALRNRADICWFRSDGVVMTSMLLGSEVMVALRRVPLGTPLGLPVEYLDGPRSLG